MESARRAAGRLPLQIAIDWLLQPYVPSQCRRDVRARTPAPRCLFHGAHSLSEWHLNTHHSARAPPRASRKRAAARRRLHLAASCSPPDKPHLCAAAMRRSGTVCLDVINQTWSPMFDLLNVFEVFLPQLLLYPNPTDPLNGEAAALMLREPESYNARIRDTVAKYANAAPAAASADDDDDDDDEMSDDDD